MERIAGQFAVGTIIIYYQVRVTILIEAVGNARGIKKTCSTDLTLHLLKAVPAMLHPLFLHLVIQMHTCVFQYPFPQE
jgi:hypothetical protein